MKLKFQPVDELDKNIALIKQKVRQKQFPKHHAPKLDSDMLIVLSGCSLRVHRQTKNELVLKADEKINFDNNINVVRILSYIAGVYDHVSIHGWDWRVNRYKKNKLFLTPYAPTLIEQHS